MKFIDSLLRNKFLKELFPQDLTQDIFLGQLCLQMDDDILMRIHIKEKPVIDIKKWGIWGQNYDIIVIELSGHRLKKINVLNWQLRNFCQLRFTLKSELLCLNFGNETWQVDLELESLIFQKSSVYSL